MPEQGPGWRDPPANHQRQLLHHAAAAGHDGIGELLILFTQVDKFIPKQNSTFPITATLHHD
jgi:hypothetical protein